jgi:CheY-like chemotaxis protein
VTVAQNGRQAVDIFTQSPESFDIIFMDVQLPKLSGIEATGEIRQRGFDKIPIVAMTAHAMKDDGQKCIAAGMNDYIAKPIKREIIFEMVNKWVMERPPS